MPTAKSSSEIRSRYKPGKGKPGAGGKRRPIPGTTGSGRPEPAVPQLPTRRPRCRALCKPRLLAGPSGGRGSPGQAQAALARQHRVRSPLSRTPHPARRPGAERRRTCARTPRTTWLTSFPSWPQAPPPQLALPGVWGFLLPDTEELTPPQSHLTTPPATGGGDPLSIPPSASPGTAPPPAPRAPGSPSSSSPPARADPAKAPEALTPARDPASSRGPLPPPAAPHPPALGEPRAARTSDACSPSRAPAGASLTAAGTGRRVRAGSERLPPGSALRPLRGPESRVLPRRQQRKLSVRRPCPPPPGADCAGARVAPPLPSRPAGARVT